MSTARIEFTPSTVQVEPTRGRQTARPDKSGFGDVLSVGAHLVLTGAEVVGSVVGGPIVGAVFRMARTGLTAVLSSQAGGAGAAPSGGAPGSEIEQVHALHRESQAFSLQLLNLQREVQDENRRFTTLSNVLKASHDTAKAAVNNIRS